ncbi:MAG: hyalin domain-containing, partial [Prolixibacteraceae bacterium]
MKNIYETLRTSRAALMALLVGLLMLAANVARSQEVTIATDKDDYLPGEWVMITGTGWLPGETVQLTLIHIEPNIPDHTHDDVWEVIADGDGNFHKAEFFFVEEKELNTAFELTALGLTSRWVAITTFTDGNSITFNTPTQVGTINTGTGGTATYAFNIGRDGAGNTFTTTLSTSTLPTGVAAAFSPNPITFPPGATRTSTLTLTVASTVPAGSYTFTVSGTDSKDGTSANITLTVSGCAQPNSTDFTGNTICAGGTGTLTFDAINATFSSPYTIVYTNGTTQWSQVIATASETTFNVAVNPTITTNYTLVSITNGAGCVRTTGFTDATAEITVRPLPAAPSAGNITTTYDGTLKTGTATVPTGITVDWYDAATGGNATTAPSGTNAGTYTAWAEARNTT